MNQEPFPENPYCWGEVDLDPKTIYSDWNIDEPVIYLPWWRRLFGIRIRIRIRLFGMEFGKYWSDE